MLNESFKTEKKKKEIIKILKIPFFVERVNVSPAAGGSANFPAGRVRRICAGGPCRHNNNTRRLAKYWLGHFTGHSCLYSRENVVDFINFSLSFI